MKNTEYTAYYDRQPGTISGWFTLQNNEGKKIFTRLSARSGSYAAVNFDWVRGKSPIPYGRHRLWLNPVNRGQWAGSKGIGEFFPVSNGDNPRLIAGPNGGERWDIGLHPENGIPGSAGCTVLLADTIPRKNEVRKLFDFLYDLKEQGYSYIDYLVL